MGISSEVLTTGELSRLLKVPQDRIREAVDQVAPDCPRAGNYRLISCELVGDIVLELNGRGRRPRPEQDGLEVLLR
jgi:hypothetical protein